MRRIVVDGGLAIRIEGRPAQGTRHEVLLGALEATGEAVVVKLERVPGALRRERVALSWLTALRGPAPRLRGAGIATVDGERVECLVLQRCEGGPPTTRPGWRRMGAALAGLADLPAEHSGLPVRDEDTFGHEHATRIDDLGDRLAPLAASVPDWDRLTCARPPAPSPLVLTHGDPGPGNYLDGGPGGTLLDWEEACVAPRGLDLARLSLIALLGAGPSGYVGRDHHERARAAMAGYLGALRVPWRPTPDDWRWWITVAGVQLIHRRWRRGDQPAPWSQAADVLQSALAVSAS